MDAARRFIPEPPAATSATPSAPRDLSTLPQNIRNGERHETLRPLQQHARPHFAPTLVAALLHPGAQKGLFAQAATAQAAARRGPYGGISAVAARQAAVIAPAKQREQIRTLRALFPGMASPRAEPCHARRVQPRE